MKWPILVFKSGSIDLIVTNARRFPLTIVIGMAKNSRRLIWQIVGSDCLTLGQGVRGRPNEAVGRGSSTPR